MIYFKNDTGNNIGDIPSQPESGTIRAVLERAAGFYKISFTFDRVRVPITDAGASGSYGSLKIFTHEEGVPLILGSRCNLTEVTEGPNLTSGAGDAVMELSFSTVPITAARDGSLTLNQSNLAYQMSFTMSGGVGSSDTSQGVIAGQVDGTQTPVDIYMNVSGTAATIDASDYIDVSGTFTVTGCMVGDD